MTVLVILKNKFHLQKWSCLVLFFYLMNVQSHCYTNTQKLELHRLNACSEVFVILLAVLLLPSNKALTPAYILLTIFTAWHSIEFSLESSIFEKIPPSSPNSLHYYNFVRNVPIQLKFSCKWPSTSLLSSKVICLCFFPREIL